MQGKYRTILYLSVVYCLGNWVMAASAYPEPSPSTRNTLFWSTSAALGLIAFGTGGIKPCGAAFGGDQIQHALPEGPLKERVQRQFFSIYYLAINVGSFFSTLAGPYLHVRFSYSFAFAVPAVFMMGALVIFWLGRKTYYNQPPQVPNSPFSDYRQDLSINLYTLKESPNCLISCSQSHQRSHNVSLLDC